MTLSLTIPCRADEPDLGSTLESLLTASLSPQLPVGCVRELLICINGVGPDRACPEPSRRACPPLLAVRDFCTRHALPVQEIELSSQPNQPNQLNQLNQLNQSRLTSLLRGLMGP